MYVNLIDLQKKVEIPEVKEKSVQKTKEKRKQKGQQNQQKKIHMKRTKCDRRCHT